MAGNIVRYLTREGRRCIDENEAVNQVSIREDAEVLLESYRKQLLSSGVEMGRGGNQSKVKTHSCGCSPRAGEGVLGPQVSWILQVWKAMNCQARTAGLREEAKVTPAGAEIQQEADGREPPFLTVPATFLPQRR